MNNTTVEKILGSALLLIGLAIIGYSLYLGVNVFVKAQDPPEIFKPPVAATNLAPTEPAKTSIPIPKNINEINPADLQKMISSNSVSPELIKSIIPPEMFNYTSRLMNLSVYGIFLWILITAGSKIASLGVALVKSNADVKF